MDIVLDWTPAEHITRAGKPATLYAVVKCDNQELPVVLKPDISRRPYQCIIDEIKGLFKGVKKMGTHLITIDHRVERTDGVASEDSLPVKGRGPWMNASGERTCAPFKNQTLYLMFPARVSGNCIVKESNISGIDVLSEEDTEQLRKIFVFSDIVGPSDKCASNIIRMYDGKLLSVDEMNFKKIDEPLRHQKDRLYKLVMQEVDVEKMFNDMTGGKEKFFRRVDRILKRLYEDYSEAGKVIKEVDDFSWVRTLLECRLSL